MDHAGEYGATRIYQGQPQKGLLHRALADIRDSVQELDYYRSTLFVERPTPTRT